MITLAERLGTRKNGGKVEIAIKLMEKGFSIEKVVELTGIERGN